jgi:hypothetical protein
MNYEFAIGEKVSFLYRGTWNKGTIEQQNSDPDNRGESQYDIMDATGRVLWDIPECDIIRYS